MNRRMNMTPENESTPEPAREQAVFALRDELSVALGDEIILVLFNGEVVERGTHEELLREDGFYAALWAALSAPDSGSGQQAA
jgi:ATP-binding cassette subfamily B protein